jgi:hypothetical protein
MPSLANASDEDKVLQEPAGFSNFIGTWTLKDDKFELVWDGETVESLDIPNHITVCTSETTVADDQRRTLHHLSHFGENRMGVGTGTISSEGNLKNRIVFSDEPEGTYRIYEYVWISPDEYHMMSRQYGVDDTPTGNWYGGTFVRMVD